MKQQIDETNIFSSIESNIDLKTILRFAALIALLIAIFAGIFLSPLREHLVHIREASERIRSYGHLSGIVFIISTAVLTSIGAPRILFCPIAGMAFGLVPGVIYSQIGTLLGYYMVFLFVRWSGGEFLKKFAISPKGINKLLNRRGIPIVILVRQLPIHGMVINLMLSFSPIKQKDFLIGTAIGLIPEAIPATMLGCGVTQQSFFHSARYIAMAILFLAAAAAASRIFIRYQKNLISEKELT